MFYPKKQTFLSFVITGELIKNKRFKYYYFLNILIITSFPLKSKDLPFWPDTCSPGFKILFILFILKKSIIILFK